LIAVFFPQDRFSRAASFFPYTTLFRSAIAAFASVAAWGALLAMPRDIAAKTVPVRLSDQEFWKTVMTFSEPGGAFRSSGAVRSDNLISNETSFQQVIPALWSAVRRGAYLGVGPEQNFTYIAALK